MKLHFLYYRKRLKKHKSAQSSEMITILNLTILHVCLPSPAPDCLHGDEPVPVGVLHVQQDHVQPARQDLEGRENQPGPQSHAVSWYILFDICQQISQFGQLAWP